MSLSMRGKAAWAAFLGLALGSGCSLYVGDVDRTQPDKVEKAYFTDGKPWYFRQTIIDIPATSGLTFIGEQGGTHKIVWQIDENYLYAYRAHEWLVGGEEYAARPGVAYTGTPVAAFVIQSHFDIKRDYNAQTGEQTNVIGENASDRPWYERDYMRVDWSRNLIADFSFVGGYVSQQPGGRYVRAQEDSRDAIQIGSDYVDIVHWLITEPETNAYLTQYYGFPIPTCWLYSSIYADCLGSTLKVRSSFMKVPTDNVYEPLTYDDHRFDKFGYFRTDRYGYDRQFDISDNKVQYLIERFNIWKRAPGEADCKDDSLEHPWANCGNDRIRPIVYYVNEDFPENLRAAEKRVTDDWNDVFKDTVSAMTGRAKADLPDVVVGCVHNPVQAGDPAACGEPGFRPQIGDLRYNFVYYVRNPQESSPLGYGPHAADPETGEVISANAFIYGSPLETYSQWALDSIKLMNGDLSVADFYDGANISAHYQAVKEQAAASAMRVDPAALAKLAKSLKIPEQAANLRQRLQRGELQQEEIPGRLETVRNSAMNGVFFNESMRRALTPQFENASDAPAGMEKYLSSATLHDPVFRRAHAQRDHRLSSNAVCMAEFFDDGLAGWARMFNCNPETGLDPNNPSDKPLRDRFCTADNKLNEQAAYDYLLEDIYVGVTLHEVGHNMGLRHNFAASTDSINYFPKYWELRGFTLAGGQTTLKPEWTLTSRVEKAGLEDALKMGLRDAQYSSIMDYGAKPNSDILGLGLYDRAAIKYGYGLMLDVFDADAAEAPPQVARSTGYTTNAMLLPGTRHYTQYPELIANDESYTYEEKVASIYKRRTVTEARVKADANVTEVPYRFCSDEYVNGTYFCYRFDAGADAYEQVANVTNMYQQYYWSYGLRRGRVGFGMNLEGYINRVYGRYFEFMSAQNKHFINDELINRFWDTGCDEPEAGGIHFADSRCGLDRFAAALASGNALGRALQTPEPGCYIRLKNGCYQQSNESVNGIAASTVKQPDAFCANNGSGAVLVNDKTAYTRIENSSSCDPYLTQLTAGGQDIYESPLDVPLGVGRYSLDKYDRSLFGYSFYWKPTTIGSWWDKWLAMEALGDPYTDFIGVDAMGNARSFLISFNTLFRNQVQGAVSAYITEDYNYYAPWVIKTAEGTPTLKFQDLVAPVTSDVNSGWSKPFERPVGALTLNPEGDGQYMTRLQALFIGAVYYTQITDDQDFNQGLAVYKAGSTVDITVAPEVKADPERYVEVTDPATGAIYYAVKLAPGTAWGIPERPFYSTGFEYLKRLRDEFMTADGRKLRDPEELEGLRSELRMIEIMRGLVNLWGFANSGGFIW